MEELVRSKLIVIEVEGKEYKLGFPTRKDVKEAENKGLDVLNNTGKLVTLNDKLFYTGLLAEQPSITEREATKLLEKYIEEDGDLDEVITFLTNQYLAFIKSPNGKNKKKKKAKIVEI